MYLQPQLCATSKKEGSPEKSGAPEPNNQQHTSPDKSSSRKTNGIRGCSFSSGPGVGSRSRRISGPQKQSIMKLNAGRARGPNPKKQIHYGTTPQGVIIRFNETLVIIYCFMRRLRLSLCGRSGFLGGFSPVFLFFLVFCLGWPGPGLSWPGLSCPLGVLLLVS